MTQMVSGAPALTDSVFALRSGASPTNLIFAIRDIFNLYSTGTHSKDIYGNMTVYGVLNVTGDVFTRNNTHLGNSITDTTYVIGAARVSGDVYVSGHGVFTGDLNASGNTSLGRNSSSTTRVSGTLTVNGSGDFHNTLNLRKGAVNSLGYTGLGNHVFGTDSSNSQTLKGTVGVTNSINVGGDLAVFGNKTTAGNERITGTLGVGGNVFLSGNLEAGSYASSHTALINSTTTVRKATFLESTLGVSSHATFSGNLNVSGTVNLGDSATDVVNIAGIANCKSLFVGANMSVAGGEIVAGSSTIMGTGLFVGGAFTNGLRVSGTTNLGSSSSNGTNVIGSLRVAQNSTFSGSLIVNGIYKNNSLAYYNLADKKIYFTCLARCGNGRATYNALYGTIEIPITSPGWNDGEYIFITGKESPTTLDVRYCGWKQMAYVSPTGIGIYSPGYGNSSVNNGVLVLAHAVAPSNQGISKIIVRANNPQGYFGAALVNNPYYLIYYETPYGYNELITHSYQADQGSPPKPFTLFTSGNYHDGSVNYAGLMIMNSSDGTWLDFSASNGATNKNLMPAKIFFKSEPCINHLFLP